MTLPARGLYAVTPDGVDSKRLVTMVEQALKGGAALVQYRATPGPDAGIARALLDRCHAHQVPLLINDDMELADAIGADGVHLGGDDMAVDQARGLLGEQAIVGASCYNDLDRAAAAVDASASYLAFGSVYPSPTKPGAVHCPLEVIRKASRRFDLPIAAIGGITVDNGAAVVAAGAGLLAVISDLFSASDVAEKAGKYGELFEG